MARGATHAASLSLGRFPRTRPGTLLLPDERTKGTHRGESALCCGCCQVTISGTPRPRTTARKQQAGQEDACNPVYPLFCSPPTSSKLTPAKHQVCRWQRVEREYWAGSTCRISGDEWTFVSVGTARRFGIVSTPVVGLAVVVVGVRGESVVAVVVAITLQHWSGETKECRRGRCATILHAFASRLVQCIPSRRGFCTCRNCSTSTRLTTLCPPIVCAGAFLDYLY